MGARRRGGGGCRGRRGRGPGWSLVPASWKRTAGSRSGQLRWTGYLLAGGAAAATIGPWLVLVLLGCGVAELAIRHQPLAAAQAITVFPLLAARAVRTAGPARALGAAAGAGVLLPVAWTALKVGALSFGGGFVIIPLMQADATSHHWMTSGQFLNGVALGQITPGPVVQTVAIVGYAAAGIGGGLLAAADRVRPVVRVRARRRPLLRRPQRQQPRPVIPRRRRPGRDRRHRWLGDPAGPRPVQPWQYAVLAAAALLLLGLRRGVVLTLLAAAAAGVIAALAGGPLPH